VGEPTRSILHCIPTIGGGGAERQLAYLAGELTTLGWDVHVALLAEGPNGERLKAGGAEIHRMTGAGNYDPRIFARLMGLMRALEPAIVQTWFVQMEIAGGLAARLMRVPWILSERSSELAHPPTLKNRFRARLASGASAIVANSWGGDRYWQARLASRIPRYVVPNALPLEEIARARPPGPEDTGLRPDDDVILYVGRFSPEKNLEVLVAALGLALARPRTVAVLCGEGPQRAAVERWLREQGIADRVRLLGFVPDVWGWMKRAAVLVSPSIFEGRPNVVLEAMACGCPLVVSDIAAHREFLDDASALLVKPDLPTALADAIVNVLSLREAAGRRADRARAKAAEWSVPVIGREYDRIYRDVLAGGARAGRRAG
jgi:glycosyltransferase involved in cell wall biosynthesis